MGNRLDIMIGIVTYRPLEGQVEKYSGDLRSLKNSGIDFVFQDKCRDTYRGENFGGIISRLEESNMIYVYNLAAAEGFFGDVCPKKVVNLACKCHRSPRNPEYRTIRCGCRMPDGLSLVIKDVKEIFIGSQKKRDSNKARRDRLVDANGRRSRK